MTKRLSYWFYKILGACACIAIVGYFSAYLRMGHEKKIVCDPLYHDFGTVQTNTVVNHVFLFQNTTSQAIRPISVSATCNCVSVNVEHKWISPGENVVAKVALQTRQTASEMNQTMKLNFDDPELTPVELKVHATVRPELYVSTEKITIGFRAGEAAKSSTFRVSNFGSQRWNSVQVAANADWVTVKCNDETPNNSLSESSLQSWMCSLNLNLTDMSAGIHHAKLTVTTDPKTNSATIPIELNLIPELVAFPGSWYSFESEDKALDNSSKIVVRSDLSGELNSLTCIVSESLEGFLSLQLRKGDGSERANNVFLLTGTWTVKPQSEITGQVEVFYGSDSKKHSIVIPVLYVPRSDKL